MVHFIEKWSHFYNLPAVFLNVTPKLDMLKKSFFSHRFHICAEIPAIIPSKKKKFYNYILRITKSYNTLKSRQNHAHTGLTP